MCVLVIPNTLTRARRNANGEEYSECQPRALFKGLKHVLLLTIAVLAVTSLLGLQTPPAKAAPQPRSKSASKAVRTSKMSDAQTKAELAASASKLKPQSKESIDQTDAEGYQFTQGSKCGRFVSYGLGKASGHRSFIGAYKNKSGRVTSTVEVVFTGAKTAKVWVNGQRTQAASSSNGTVHPMKYKRGSKCWWAYEYATGQVAWGGFVAAVGGASAIFDGPIGAIIAAAGGLESAKGGINVWVVDFVCS